MPHINGVYPHLINVDLMPDFALHSGGAVVIPNMTSATLDACSPFKGFPATRCRPPVTALHPGTNNGQCWPIEGNTGHLGVALAKSVYISNVTIEHVHYKAAFDVRSAPKDMELWGLIEGDENSAKVKEWRRRRLVLGYSSDQGDPQIHGNMQFLRLSTFTFNAKADQNIQTFPLDEALGNLSIDFSIVLLLIKNNWGNNAYTCLYRFRVHGQQI